MEDTRHKLGKTPTEDRKKENRSKCFHYMYRKLDKAVRKTDGVQWNTK